MTPLRTLILLWAAACLVAACATTEQLAPRASGVGSAQLTEGRRLYMTCAGSCHAPEPVLKYTRAEWLTTIVPEMSQEAKLSPQQVAALSAYLKTVCTR